MRKGSQMLVSGIPLQEASQADAFKRRPFGTSIDQYTKEIIGGNALSFPSKWWFALRQVDLQVWKLTFPFTHLSGFTFVGIGGPPSQSSLAPSPLPNEGLPPPFQSGGTGHLSAFSAFWSQEISYVWVQSVISRGYKQSPSHFMLLNVCSFPIKIGRSLISSLRASSIQSFKQNRGTWLILDLKSLNLFLRISKVLFKISQVSHCLPFFLGTVWPLWTSEMLTCTFFPPHQHYLHFSVSA